MAGSTPAAIATDAAPQDRFWDVYSAVYDSVYHLMSYRKLLWDTFQALELQPGMRVLDAGCGTGNFEHFIGQKQPPPVEIDAVDFSPNMLAIAKKKCAGQANVHFQQADLSAPLPFEDATFDRIVSINVFYALPDPDATLRELLRVLKPSGELVLTSPTPDFRVAALVADHFRRVKNIWGARRKVVSILTTVWLLFSGGAAQWVLNTFIINRREAQGQYNSLHAEAMHELFSRRRGDGLAEFAIGSALADQNIFATGTKSLVA